MVAKTTIDKAGRIVLPKAVRDELQLAPGDSLELETSGEQVTLRPVRGSRQLRKKRGIWVLQGGPPVSLEMVNETIQKIRRERDEKNMGKWR